MLLPQGAGLATLLTKRLSSWTREYLCYVALVDLGCAVIGVFIAAQIRFGSEVTNTHMARA